MNRYILILTLLFTYNCWSQQKEIKISGKILNEETNKPLEYATIAFYSSKENKMITGGITELNGNFSVSIPQGIYDISIEYISFETKTLPKQKIFKDSDIGIIKLKSNTENLDDVVILSEKTTVEIKLDKKIYNVGKDLTVSGGTVSDVLDNVPSVSVDVEGNVLLRGNDNVRILINGKPSGLTGLNSTEALRQLPAESIERVEVITSPSARYDAEGTAGILNIILRRSKLQGLNGAITINTGFPLTAGASGNLNYRTGDINFFTTLGYKYSEIPGSVFNYTHFLNKSINLKEERDIDRTRKGYNTDFGIEWYINETSSITSSIAYLSNDKKSNTTNTITEYNNDGLILSKNFRYDPEIEDNNTKQYSLNYTKDFNTNGHKLTFDFQVENNNEEEYSKITQDNTSITELVNTTENEDRILLQADYILPFKNNGQFEIGYRGNFNTLSTDYLLLIDNNNTITINADLSNNLIYTEKINAIYSQFGNQFDKFSYLLGLRVEESRIIIDQKTSNDFNKKKYVDFFPTINIGYEISEKQSFMLGYNRRLRRPRSRYINPFPSRSSATNLFQGNPDLNPSYSNTFDIGYLYKMKKLTLNTSLYYNKSTQNFTFISEETGLTTIIGSDENNIDNKVPVIRRTLINLSNTYLYGLEFTLTYNPNKKWRINGNFNAFQNNGRGVYKGRNLNSDNFSWFARLTNKITLPGNINWQSTFSYYGPKENTETKTKGIFNTNMAFSVDLFKEKASLTFNIVDLFNSRKRNNSSISTNFISNSEFQWRKRTFNLSFTYRFNQKKNRDKSSKINNNNNVDDDI